ncbi:MAG: T9SS type A sorting domain-containing protein [Ignavibacteriales bacterium]|nr:T9SS type A sorting domain-containing protein [Ignavibacteriales bacterium]
MYNYSESLTESGVYFYRLKQVDFDGTVAYSNVVNVTIVSPGTFTLLQNYPNPFNPSTTIAFTIPERSNVSLALFDMLGRKVKSMIDETKEAGLHTVNFNAADLASGIYFYELKAGQLREVKKLTLLK